MYHDAHSGVLSFKAWWVWVGKKVSNIYTYQELYNKLSYGIVFAQFILIKQGKVIIFYLHFITEENETSTG
jgi:hypothetical protein